MRRNQCVYYEGGRVTGKREVVWESFGDCASIFIGCTFDCFFKMATGVFSETKIAPAIEVFALVAAFNADSHPNKVNLSVGGKCWMYLLTCTWRASSNGVFYLFIEDYC